MGSEPDGEGCGDGSGRAGSGDWCECDRQRNGTFELQAKVGDGLQVSFMGYKSQEVKVANAGPIRVTLAPDNVMLQEVVAVGYGTMKKSDLTGAVTSIKADDLLKAPVSGLDQA